MARAGIFLTAKDISILTGLTITTSYRELDKIKLALNKKAHQHITITDYCHYENITEDEVKKILKR
jgi:hypothetical protein